MTKECGWRHCQKPDEEHEECLDVNNFQLAEAIITLAVSVKSSPHTAECAVLSVLDKNHSCRLCPKNYGK